jgi:hypothetical protein
MLIAGISLFDPMQSFAIVPRNGSLRIKFRRFPEA